MHHPSIGAIVQTFYHLGIDDHTIRYHQTRNKFSDRILSIHHLIARLLPLQYTPVGELHRERILMRLCQQTMPKVVEHLHGTADDPFRLVPHYSL